jgi:hypothetical protein
LSASNSSNFANNSSNSSNSSANHASNSSNFANNSSNSANSASASASTATTQAGFASSNAATATTQAGFASANATLALGYSSNSSNFSNNASNFANTASNAANAANAARDAALTAADNFDDTYLGAKASDPSVDNDGGALNAGDLYFNTVSNTLQVYSGSAWQTAAASTAGFATITGSETLTNKTLTAPKIVNGGFIADANGNEQIKFTTTTSAINELTVTNSAAGNSPDLSVTGGDTNIGLSITTKGTGLIKLNDGAYFPEATLTDGATITWDVSTAQVAKVTLGGARTLSAPTNGATGQFVSLLVIQDGTGSRTLTWNAAYEFASDTAPTLTTTASLGDLFTFRYNGTKWLETGRNLKLTLS